MHWCRSYMTIALTGILGLAIAILLRHSIPPFAIGFFWIFFCMLMIALRLRVIPRSVFYNLAFVFLALSFFEIYQTVIEAIKAKAPGMAGVVYSSHTLYDEDLGYANAKQNRVFNSVKIGVDGSLIYSVFYSLNEY